MKKKYLEIGRIVGTRGLQGELKVEPWCDSPEVICEIKKLYINSGETSINVKSCRAHKNMALVKVDGVNSIDEANKLRGKVLYAERCDIPKEDDSYFIQDLLGMSVVDIDSQREYGKIKEVFSTGANDVYTVKTNEGKLCYVPVIKDVVIDINLQEDKILIRPIEGIFDDDN